MIARPSHPLEKPMRRPLLALALCLIASPTLAAAPAPEAVWETKVDPWVLDRGRSAGDVEFLVVLAEQASVVDGAKMLRGKEAKGRFVFERLREVAARTQGAVTAELERRQVPFRAYYVHNMVWVRGTLADVEAMARRADVARIHANPEVFAMAPVYEPDPALSEPQRTPEGTCSTGAQPGVQLTGAPTLWSQGIDGTGVVVAGQDTGYDWDHQGLKAQYLGWDGATADHSYHWHDSIHTTGSNCGADSPEPCDDNGHGTHTMGTMVGEDGSVILGMAPGARWMGCRNMNEGNGTPTTYGECFQFFLAPTDSQDENPDPSRAPDVINNSWGCPPSEGCTDPNVMRAITENLRAAGVMVVASAGNSGSSCSTIDTAAPIYDAAFTVGSTNTSDNIATSSSRGPVTVDGSGRMKPDISAVGVSVCSTVPGGGYSFLSGTSMAGPHVAGLVALLIDAQPCLRGEVDALEQYIIATAVPRTTSQVCGGVPGSEVPNNTYGFGAIRAVAPTAAVCPGLFVDGFETGDTSAWAPKG
jgi:serine protease AprX